MVASADWSSLASDLVNRIAECLLATNDLDYYMDFRAVCSTWRSATVDAKTNPEPCFRPNKWIIIDEVSYSLDVNSRTRIFVNTATGRILRKDLTMLRGYYVITTGPNAFFVLVDREPPHATCVLNPFTGFLLRFMAPMVTEAVDTVAIYVIQMPHSMEVFRMNRDRGVYEPVKSIGNQAIFLGHRMCVPVNADKFPSVHANCIYYLGSLHPCVIYMYDLKDGKEERVSGAIETINHVFQSDADPPFTIIQLLSSYTLNAWGSELQTAKSFEGIPDMIPDAENFGLSAFFEDLEFGD
ncbi:unnamed protein product [Alopecurus aequalis]